MNEKTDKCICHQIKLKVTKRKYNLDPEFVDFIRSYKTISNYQIAEAMDIPITNVEHWFRKDKYKSIPLPEHWEALKQILCIPDSKYDAQINEFVVQDCNYDMAQRVYDSIGIAPTIEAVGDVKIIERRDKRKEDR